MKSSRQAVFLDRDGTICVDDNYIYKKEDFVFFPETFEALRFLSQRDYKLVVVTNQAGIAKGYYTEDDLRKLHEYMLSVLSDKGIKIDGIYFCPHHPDFTGDCNCRKPKSGMLERASRKLDIDLNKSFMIGDRDEDIVAGKNAGCKTILIQGEQNPSSSDKYQTIPDFRAKNLLEAIKYIDATNRE